MASTDTDIANLREEYKSSTLIEADVHVDPLIQFQQWFAQARAAQLPEANAMALATINANGSPASRVVLLKGLEHGGFTFYTNYNSAKGQQIAANPQVALVFLWYPLERQVRIEGRITKLPAAESDAYFAQRPLGSQLGAWASPQSEVVTRESLEQNMRDVTDQYGENPPRPPHWGGYLVTPDMIEFWQGRRSRLHDRIRYQRDPGNADNNDWKIDRLGS